MKYYSLIIAGALIAISCTAQQKSASGKVFRDCTTCPEMVIIPGGSFLMGSPESEKGHLPEEGPQRNVNIASFAIGKFTTTRGEWATFVASTKRVTQGGCAWSNLPPDSAGGRPWNLNKSAAWNHLGFSQTDDDPVVCVTWRDVEDYLSWISSKTGKHYRLLTEAEWEYAARAGTSTAYYWGDMADHNFSNYGADSGYVGRAEGRDKWIYTSPVGTFPPNSFGLFDMTGNVSQYVQDYFSPSYKSLSADGSGYLQKTIIRDLPGYFSYMNGTGSEDYRMIRGGNYGDPPSMLRVAYRNWTPGRGSDLQHYASAGLGFRIARSL